MAGKKSTRDKSPDEKSERARRVFVTSSDGIPYTVTHQEYNVLAGMNIPKSRDNYLKTIGKIERLPEPINCAGRQSGHLEKQIPNGNGSRKSFAYNHRSLY